MLADTLLHSETPLFGDKYTEKWPQHFTDETNQDFGCASRVAFGDWAYVPRDLDKEPSWYRFHNYGVFHCWAIVSAANERTDLASSTRRPSFFVKLGDARVNGALTELWALQMGARPGSDYLLLARSALPKTIDRFTVLQRACPTASRIVGEPLSILRTDYCLVESREALVALARAMLRRPPLATLELKFDEEATAEPSP